MKFKISMKILKIIFVICIGCLLNIAVVGLTMYIQWYAQTVLTNITIEFNLMMGVAAAQFSVLLLAIWLIISSVSELYLEIKEK